jgi:hypothetical protein
MPPSWAISRRFAALGFPLLIGLSRKRIVRTLHPETLDRDLASARMAFAAWRNGAAILRMSCIACPAISATSLITISEFTYCN